MPKEFVCMRRVERGCMIVEKVDEVVGKGLVRFFFHLRSLSCTVKLYQQQKQSKREFQASLNIRKQSDY